MTAPATETVDAAALTWPGSVSTVASTPLQNDGGGVAGGRATATTSLLNVAKLTIPQAAKQLGIGETKMRQIVRDGWMPVLCVAGKILVLERDLDAYMAGQYGRLSAAKPNPSRQSGMVPLPQGVRDSALLRKERRGEEA